MSRCKEDDIAITIEEIACSGEKDKEFKAVKKEVLRVSLRNLRSVSLSSSPATRTD